MNTRQTGWLLAALLVVVLAMVGPAASATEGASTDESTSGDVVEEHSEPIVPRNDLSIGGELYRSECAACHTATGLGGALSFRDNAPPLLGFTSLQIAAAIRGGPGEMPFFGPESISDEELNQIVTYVEYLKSPDDAGGAPIFRAGPLAEGFIAWVFGMSGIVLGLMWIGDRRA